MLTVNNLTIEFHDEEVPFKAVNRVSFTMKQGEILGLVGESGSGKSQTALAIAGLIKRNYTKVTGEILFQGSDFVTQERKKLRLLQGNSVGMIFQDPLASLNPLRTIGWQVGEALRIHTTLSKEEIKERILETLQEVKLPEPERIYDSYPFELSGGMRQRCLIAAAIITRPKLLIADEPTTALDVTIQEEIISLLKELHKKYGCSILFISHDLSLVKAICTNVCVMKDGEIVERGSVKEIFCSPQNAYTQKLVDAIPAKLSKDDYNQNAIENKKTADTLLAIEHYSFYYDNHKLTKLSDMGSFFCKKESTTGTKKSERTERWGIRDISLTLHKGDICALVGESGSGKSTLAKCIAGLLGEQKNREGFPKCAMVFQDSFSSLNPSKKVGWILREALVLQGIRNKEEIRKRIEEILLEVELPFELLNRYPLELSGGQRQRVGIGAALLSSPELLIADEPVSALDVTIQRQIVELFMKLREKRGITILFISHDLRTVFRLCDEVYVMKNGKILESGDRYEIYFNPKNEYTRQLIRAAMIETEDLDV